MKSDQVQLPAYFKPLMIAIVGIPMIISFLFTQMQWFPATYAIEWLTGDDGKFSFKLAVVLNWALIVIPLAIVAIIVMIIVRSIKRSKNKNV